MPDDFSEAQARIDLNAKIGSVRESSFWDENTSEPDETNVELRAKLKDVYERALSVMETAKGPNASTLAWEFIHNLCMEAVEHEQTEGFVPVADVRRVRTPDPQA